MKKILTGFITTALVIGATVGLVACGGNPGGGKGVVDHTSSSQDLLGMAMSSAGIYAPANSNATSKAAEQLTEDEIVNSIEERIAIIQDFVKTGKGPSCTITNYEPEDPNGEFAIYDKKMVVTKNDLYDETKSETYTFIYHEVKEDGTDVDESDEADLETEEEFKLVGKLLIDGNYYDMVGERSVETEGDETESEFEAKVTFTDGSSMTIKQEIEIEGNEREEEFTYTFVDKNGNKDTFTMEIENEDGENEIKYVQNGLTIELEEEFKANSRELELKYIDTANGINQIAKVEIKQEGNEEVRVYKINGKQITRKTLIEAPAPDVNENTTEDATVNA